MTNRQLKAPAAFAIVVTFPSIFGPVMYQSGYEDRVAFERGRQFVTARWDMAPGQMKDSLRQTRRTGRDNDRLPQPRGVPERLRRRPP